MNKETQAAWKRTESCVEYINSLSANNWVTVLTRHLMDVLGLEKEVNVGGRKRADLASDDLTYVIELKSSKQDIWSGYGVNFVGAYNYIFTRPELMGEAIEMLDDRGFRGVGVVSFWHICGRPTYIFARTATLKHERLDDIFYKKYGKHYICQLDIPLPLEKILVTSAIMRY